MTDRLLALGHDAVVYDNCPTGHVQFLDDARQSPHLTIVRGDNLDADAPAALTIVERVYEQSGYDFR